jgi:predicted ArsR family transcriptional regulator
MTTSVALHRALADPRRAELAAELEAAVDALDASELAERVGLHANTVRWHLGVMEQAGLVRSETERRSTRGRPRRLWRRVAGATRDDAEEHRALARALVSLVAGRPGAAADAEAAGRAWGERLARETDVGSGNGLETVVGVLRERGFAPEADGLDVTMRRCPFADLARESPEVVCAVHRGLVDGVLREGGSDLTVAELRVHPRPDVCVLRLARRDGGGRPDGQEQCCGGQAPAVPVHIRPGAASRTRG